MNATITQDMADGMDDMAGLLPPHLPASTNSAFYWEGQPSTIGATLRPKRVDRSTAPKHYAYSLEGQAAGQKSADRRDAIRRGGI